jgi:hypothetical protein
MMNNLMQGLAPHARQGTTEDLEPAKGAFTGSARTLDGAPACRLASDQRTGAMHAQVYRCRGRMPEAASWSMLPHHIGTTPAA